jgi:GNAT superfamily N-acetyltransferase
MIRPLDPSDLVEWDPSRAGDLRRLVADALPGEDLAEEDLAGVVFDRPVPRVVLASAGGEGAVALGVHGDIGSVDVLVVAPEHRRRGIGTALLDAGVDWLQDRGCRTVAAGGQPPRYLWAGVDRDWIAGMALLERAGFRRGAAIMNLSCPTAPVPGIGPAGAHTERVSADTAAAAIAACDEHFPHWTAELEAGIDRGRAFVAVDDDDGRVLGFACHGVSRAGWFGPTGTFPPGVGRRVGTALLAAALVDMRDAGHDRCEISWVGPVGFYARVVEVRAGRTFVVHQRRLAPSPAVSPAPIGGTRGR